MSLGLGRVRFSENNVIGVDWIRLDDISGSNSIIDLLIKFFPLLFDNSVRIFVT
jgi:hypothetical protein